MGRTETRRVIEPSTGGDVLKAAPLDARDADGWIGGG